MPNTLETAILTTQDTFFTSDNQCPRMGHSIEFNMGLGWQIRALR
jgi:hypothetical protein